MCRGTVVGQEGVPWQNKCFGNTKECQVEVGTWPITQLLKKLRKGIYEFKASLDNMIKIKITKWARDTAQWPNASPASPGINVTYWEKRWMGSLRLCKQ